MKIKWNQVYNFNFIMFTFFSRITIIISKKNGLMIDILFYIFPLMIYNGCLLNLEIICFFFFCSNKTSALPFSSQVFMNWNGIGELYNGTDKIYMYYLLN
jgi:hypothetical protein